MRIGVLAAQGAFIEHIAVLNKLGVEALPVRLPRQLSGLDGLIIPGGESTSISNLIDAYELRNEIKRLAENGLPIFGTCAGMIMLASEITDGNKATPLGLMNISVRRNAFGRQVDSFEADLSILALGSDPFHCIFIRAPFITQANSDVEVLANLSDGTIVAAREGKMLVSAFHPELTDDTRFHRYFLDIIEGKQ